MSNYSLFNFMFHSIFNQKKVATTTIGTDVNIGVNQFYTVNTNGLSIHGNTGFERVTIAQNVSGITIDSMVESVALSGVKFDPSTLVSTHGTLTVGNLATLSIAANNNESLSFSNAVGTLSLDNSGNGIFNLSQIQLDTNQNFTADTNNLQVYGNSGQETVTLAKDVKGVGISSAVETVVFSGNSSDYSYVTKAGAIIVSDKTTGDNVASIYVNPASTGTEIQFADKILHADWEITSSSRYWNHFGVVVTDPTASTPATTPVPVPTTTTISGGTNLHYSVDFSQASLGNNLANVEADVKTALDNIGKYISSKVPFNLKVLTEQTSPSTLAKASATMENTSSANGATQSTEFLADSISGVNANGSAPDATLYINLADLNQMSFNGAPTSHQYDLTSILTHEILHGLAFTGNLPTGGAKTPYDSLVTMQNNVPVFTGTHAEAANNNNPIPLDPASAGSGSAYYHVKISGDLMSDSIGTGEVRTISALDVAMLQDMGLTVVGVPPTPVTA